MKLTFLLILALIILDAIGDGLKDERKPIAHTVESIFILFVLFFAWQVNVTSLKDFVILVIWYSANRLLLFDLFYNLTRKLPYFYIGNTSIWDRVTRKIQERLASFYPWLKIVICIVVNGWVLYNYKF